MSKGGDNSSGEDNLSDNELCKTLNQDGLRQRVRRMNQEIFETKVPVHDVPTSIVVSHITREKKAVVWSRLCEEGGRAGTAQHMKAAIRTRPEEQRLTWEDEYPRSPLRSTFKPQAFHDEPSDSSEDEAAR